MTKEYSKKIKKFHNYKLVMDYSNRIPSWNIYSNFQTQFNKKVFEIIKNKIYSNNFDEIVENYLNKYYFSKESILRKIINYICFTAELFCCKIDIISSLNSIEFKEENYSNRWGYITIVNITGNIIAENGNNISYFKIGGNINFEPEVEIERFSRNSGIEIGRAIKFAFADLSNELFISVFGLNNTECSYSDYALMDLHFSDVDPDDFTDYWEWHPED